MRSFDAQRPLRSPLINRATTVHRSGESLAVEYPLLDSDIWKPLGDDFAPVPLSDSLAQIALTLDYLHLTGTVHGDLKPGNFMYCRAGDGFRLRLVDLDFLSPAGQSPEASIFGTPGYIAPEILNNQTVLPQSDTFSLGMALKYFLETSGAEQPVELGRGLEALIAELTQDDYIRRPKDLLKALRRHGVIDDSTYESFSRQLFAHVLLSQYRLAGRKHRRREEVDAYFRKRCRIVGLSDNFVLAAGVAAEVDFRRARTIIAEFLQASTVTRAGNHFLIQSPDSVLINAYRQFADASAHDLLEGDEPASYSGVGWPEAAFLASLDALDEDDVGRTMQLAAEAYELNRLNQADELFSRALGSASDLERYLAYFDIAVYTCIKLGQNDRAEDLIVRGIPAAQQVGDLHLRLVLQRTLGWLHMAKGKRQEAETLLAEVRRQSQAMSFRDVEAAVEYSIGVMRWREGKYDKASVALGLAIELAEIADPRVQISALSTLALVKFETSDYRAAAQVAKAAVNRAAAVGQGTLITPTCQVLVDVYVRLADFPKADYWLRRQYSELARSFNPGQLLYSLQLSAFLALWRGDLMQAEEACSEALEMIRLVPVTKPLGKVYHVLAECALLRGDLARMQTNLDAARDVLRRFDDPAALAELDIIEFTGRLVYEQDVDKQRVYAAIDTLLDRKSHFYAALGLYHLLGAGETLDDEMRRRRDRLSAVIADHQVPMYRALSSLLYPNEANGISGLLRAWKDAFTELNETGDRFRAMIAAERLSTLYLQVHRAAPARKYLLQTRQLAERLQCEPMTRRINETIAVVSQTQNMQWNLIENFHDISEVLKEVHNYPRMLHRLVQCAVDQTGAERGVILLNTGNAAGLRVVAAYNCDDDSLADILDFSRSIPRSVAADSLTVLIENATKDSRTRSLKSVITHNILSVAAVPLSLDGQVLGVLYLDHHAIPALFEESDKQYIDAVANFVAIALSNAQAYRILQTKSDQMEQRLEKLGESGKFVSRDPRIAEIFEQLDRIAQTSASVLLLGASGTGKEIMAERIHSLSPRAKRPLVKLNCAALASTLIESELFGIIKNAATNVAEREGRLAAAEGGTLFLDEIGDMPLEVQAKLLRVVENQEYEKVGSNRVIHSDIRFICATHRDLNALIAEEKFRADLFYRINTVTVEIPPLHKRPGDIPLLIDHFLSLLARGEAPIPTPETIGLLTAYAWPGNVRELKNLMEQWCILLPGKAVTPSHLPEKMRNTILPPSGIAAVRNIEEAHIRSLWKKYQGNQSQISRALDIPLTTLRRKLKKYGLI